MIALHPAQQALGLARLTLITRDKFIALAQGRVNMNSVQYFTQVETMLHSQYELVDQLCGMVSHEGITCAYYMRP